MASLQHRNKIVIGLTLSVVGLALAASFNRNEGLGIAVSGLLMAGVNTYRMLNGNFRWACEQFEHGCANPGVVVSVDPYLVAVHTDLTQGGGEEWPVVRIDRQPLEKTRQARFAVGDRVIAVAFYGGNANVSRRHWVNFTPIVANCVSDDQYALRDLYNRMEPKDWQDMEKYVAMIQTPYVPGLYWMRPPDNKPNVPLPYFQTVKTSPKWQ
jgi:hypothetical protein